MANPFITVNDLSVSLSGRRVIDGASFSVNPGEFIGLLGPNGAGKTTLMRAVLGLVPFTGTIDVTTSLGYVPQRHDVEWDFPISVAKAVLSGRTGLVGWFRRPGRLDKEAARRAIELTNLEEFARRPIAQLSGGATPARPHRPRLSLRTRGAASRRTFHRTRRPQYRGALASF